MKIFFTFSLLVLSLVTYGQDKYNYVHFNKLTEVKGTEFVIASIEDRGKMLETKSQYLLFIDTKTSKTNQADFPKDASIGRPEQIKLDSLGINLILISAKTIDLDRKNGIDWNDPTQIILFSTNGEQRNQLTDNSFFARTWSVNRLTGALVVTGYYDSNNNNKYDKTDKNQILIYDLKSLQLKSKI